MISSQLNSSSIKVLLHTFDSLNVECLLNGTCETGECQISFEPPGYECFCHSGNYGRRCEMYNPCVLSPCQNGATCRNYSNNTFDCSCPEGFDGIHCSIPVGPACLHQEPCLNNGTCSTYKNRLFFLPNFSFNLFNRPGMDACAFPVTEGHNVKITIRAGTIRVRQTPTAPSSPTRWNTNASARSVSEVI